ncbi:MAG: trigger factor [Spirochaetaceae bacterium]|nr:MAG: trigger factor [Spirochaetaceae bacterium]
MVSDKKVERLENSVAKLTVTVDQQSVRQEYDKLLDEYSKSAQIKGFRKGKVPREVMERKFGDGLKSETMQRVLEESLKQAIEQVDEKPLSFAQPELDGELDFELDKDFSYAVRYDVFPEITLGTYTGLEIEEPQVQIGKEDLERELTALQEQNSVVIDKEDGVVARDNIVTIDYWEIDQDGNPLEGSKREDFVFTVGSGYNYYKIDDEVIGLKKGEQTVIEKSYPEDAEIEELRGTTRKIGVLVKAVKERQLPEIDDELAQDISDKYESLDDLKKDIRSRLEETVKSHVRQSKADALVEQIIENSQVTPPESMVAAELQSSWRNFVSRFGVPESQVVQLLQQQGRSPEDLFQEWRPEAEKALKGRLLINKIIEAEQIDVSDEDVDARLQEQAESSSMSFEEAKEYYQKQGMLEYLRDSIKEERLFDKLFAQSKIKKGAKRKFLDVVGRNA